MRSSPSILRRFLRLMPLLTILLVPLALAEGTADWKAPTRATRQKNPVQPDEYALSVGRDLYAQQCVSCHGKAGRGDGSASVNLEPKPRDLTATDVASETDGALFWKITGGHRPMPTFENLISADQRWHVIDYVRTLAAKPTTRP